MGSGLRSPHCYVITRFLLIFQVNSGNNYTIIIITVNWIFYFLSMNSLISFWRWKSISTWFFPNKNQFGKRFNWNFFMWCTPFFKNYCREYLQALFVYTSKAYNDFFSWYFPACVSSNFKSIRLTKNIIQAFYSCSERSAMHIACFYG